jgi:hypothetical protein
MRLALQMLIHVLEQYYEHSIEINIPLTQILNICHAYLADLCHSIFSGIGVAGAQRVYKQRRHAVLKYNQRSITKYTGSIRFCDISKMI